MAKNEKVKKKNNAKVDSIIILLIAILVIAVAALGIVFVITLKTPDVMLPENNNEITETSGTYSNYLTTNLDEVGYKEVPISSRLKSGNGVSYYISAHLGTDNYIYLIEDGSNPDTIPGGTTTGNKFGLENVVDLFGVETTNKYYVFALTSDGKVYRIDFESQILGTTPEVYTTQENIVEIYANGDAIEAKLFDNSTVIISQ